MGRIKKNVLKYGKKELNSSVSVYLDLTEPKRNKPKLPKYRNYRNLFRFGRPLNQILILHFLGHCAMQGIFSFKIPQLTNSKSFKAWREIRLNFVIY